MFGPFFNATICLCSHETQMRLESSDIGDWRLVIGFIDIFERISRTLNSFRANSKCDDFDFAIICRSDELKPSSP